MAELNFMSYIPNILTLFRLALVPWLVVLIHDNQFFWSLILFVVAGFTDALDGIIAKRFNCVTRLGEFLDPLADKALLVSAYIALAVLQHIPFWLMVVVVFRDLVIVGGYLLLIIMFGELKMHPLMISKFNTFAQILYIFAVLANLVYPFNAEQFLSILVFAVLILSIISGLKYVWIWSVKAQQMEQSG